MKNLVKRSKRKHEQRVAILGHLLSQRELRWLKRLYAEKQGIPYTRRLRETSDGRFVISSLLFKKLVELSTSNSYARTRRLLLTETGKSVILHISSLDDSGSDHNLRHTGSSYGKE